jgi:hypothetical protein
MGDLKAWNLHGPVRTLRVEHAEWNPTQEEWQTPRHYGISTFRPDGKMQEAEHHNPDGSISISTYEYDDSARLLEIRTSPPDGPAGRTIYRYDASGRRIEAVTVAGDGTRQQLEVTRSDSAGRKFKVLFLSPERQGGIGIDMVSFARDEDRPDELVIQDAEQRVKGRFLFSRDSDGRLVKAEQLAAESWLADVEKSIENEGSENRDERIAALRSIFGSGKPISIVTYTYDEAGRLAEQDLRMGPDIGPAALGGHRTTYSYDKNGLEIGTTHETYSRKIGIGEKGTMVVESEESNRQDVRFEYSFDERGNWTERVVWSRNTPNPNFERSNVERRQISYY